MSQEFFDFETTTAKSEIDPAAIVYLNILLERLYNRHELVNAQRGTTNQTAVNVGIGEQFLRIGRVAASTVKN